MKRSILFLWMFIVLSLAFIAATPPPAIAESYYDRFNASNWQNYLASYGGNCKEFARRVIKDVFGVTIPSTASDSRIFVSGTPFSQHFNERDGTPNADTIKAKFSNARTGDVVQMVWGGSTWKSLHTFIIRSKNDNGIETLEANNPSNTIMNHSYNWNDLSSRYSVNGGGFSIYRYYNGDVNSDPGQQQENPTPPTVTEDALYISTTNLPNGKTGEHYKERIYYDIKRGGEATGVDKDGNFPDGLSVNLSSGQVHIEGSPSKGGDFSFTVTIRNNEGTGSRNFTIHIDGDSGNNNNQNEDAVYISTASLPDGNTGKNYKERINYDKKRGGDANGYEISGNFPEGLSVTVSVGQVHIEGEPKYGGVYNFTLTIKNDQGSGSRNYTLKINGASKPAGDAIYISTVDLPKGNVNENYKERINYEKKYGGDANGYEIGGNFPDGLSVTVSVGQVHIEGEPKYGGTYSFTLTIKNDQGSGQRNYTLYIEGQEKQPEPVIPETFSTTNWQIIGNELEISYSGSKGSTQTKRFELIDDGDKRYVISGFPALTTLNIPDKWTLDAPKNAITIGNSAKSTPFGYDSVTVTGENKITTKYENLQFTARRIEEIYEIPVVSVTYETTSWNITGNNLVVNYKGSDGSTNTKNFVLNNEGGDKRYIIEQLPALTTINLPENWTLDTIKSAVEINDTSKIQMLGTDNVIISGPNKITTQYYNVSFTARFSESEKIITDLYYNTTNWEAKNNVLNISYKGSDGSNKTLTFNKIYDDGDEYYVLSGLPAITKIDLPESWTLDTIKDSVVVKDEGKVTALGGGAVKISGSNIIVTKYENVPFTARYFGSYDSESGIIDNFRIINNILNVDYTALNSSKTYTFNVTQSGGDTYYILSGFPVGTKIDLPENWTLDGVLDSIAVTDTYNTQDLGGGNVKIYGPKSITTKYSEIQFTARYSAPGIATENGTKIVTDAEILSKIYRIFGIGSSTNVFEYTPDSISTVTSNGKISLNQKNNIDEKTEAIIENFTVDTSGIYVIPVTFNHDIPSGTKLIWYENLGSFTSAALDDEKNYSFFEGNDELSMPLNKSIRNVKVVTRLNAWTNYSPVIASFTQSDNPIKPDNPKSENSGGSGGGGGCNSGVSILAIFLMSAINLLKKTGIDS